MSGTYFSTRDVRVPNIPGLDQDPESLSTHKHFWVPVISGPDFRFGI